MKWDEEPVEDTTPFDEDGDICVEWFFDLQGRLRKECFQEIKKHVLESCTYSQIYLPDSETNKIFIIDFANKKCFPMLPKGTSKGIDEIVNFGKQEVVIYEWGLDNIICIWSDGKQIGEDCLQIEKFQNGKIDILWFRKRVNPDGDDMRTYREYLGSDGLQYEPVPLSENPQFPFRLKKEKVLEYKDLLEIK
jgi:hypothetical protein